MSHHKYLGCLDDSLIHRHLSRTHHSSKYHDICRAIHLHVSRTQYVASQTSWCLNDSLIHLHISRTQYVASRTAWCLNDSLIQLHIIHFAIFGWLWSFYIYHELTMSHHKLREVWTTRCFRDKGMTILWVRDFPMTCSVRDTRWLFDFVESR